MMKTLVVDLVLLAGAAVGTSFVTVSDKPSADSVAVSSNSLSALRMLFTTRSKVL